MRLRWLGYLSGNALSIAIVVTSPAHSGFFVAFLLGFGLSGFGYLAGRAAE